MNIWKRYLLTRLFSTSAFILACLFGIYILIDLSVHSVRFFADGHARFAAVFLYYLHSFCMYLDLFFALTFLLSALKVLFDLTHHFELIALQMAGLSKQKLTQPLFVLAATLTLLSYANAEWIAPNAQESIESFRKEHAKRKKQAQREHVHAVTLDDGSEVVYQRFDAHEKILFDAYWIKNADELWHMKIVDLNQSPLMGRYMDHFMRNAKGQMLLADSYESRALPELPLNAAQALQKFIPFENRPLSSLVEQSISSHTDLEMIQAHLHHKLALPLLPLLISLALPPVILQFSRQLPTFLIAACSLFALIALFTVLDGMLILAENRVANPILAIWVPWAICFVLALRRFIKFS